VAVPVDRSSGGGKNSPNIVQVTLFQLVIKLHIDRFGFAVPMLLIAGIVFCGGCKDADGPEFRLNRVELLKQERMTLPPGERFENRQRKEIELALIALFGTPNEPRFPRLSQDGGVEFFAEELANVPEDLNSQSQQAAAIALFQLGNLKQAAGVVSSDEQGVPSGLYREHCAHCHGLAGDGAGSTAGFLNPYPRDFRLGKFKFKSTPLRQSPTHQDMIDLLKRGIPGTAMPSFQNLPDQHLAALADYVRYLTVRGEFERFLIAELARLDDEPLLQSSLDSQLAPQLGDDSPLSVPQIVAGLTEAQLGAIANEAIQKVGVDVLERLIDRWYMAEQRVTEVPPPPAQFLATSVEHHQLVDHGFTLFLEKGNCAQCHVVGMLKSHSLDNFDDWTSDWVKTTGVDPTNKNSYRDFIQAGALPPRPVRPRILDLAVMRGGSEPEQIYRRIANGIEGTPMPSAPTLSSDEIWALVAYVLSLPQPQHSAD